MSTFIVVFEDGETWSRADAAMLVELTDAQLDKLEAGNTPRSLGLRGVPVWSEWRASSNMPGFEDYRKRRGLILSHFVMRSRCSKRDEELLFQELISAYAAGRKSVLG